MLNMLYKLVFVVRSDGCIRVCVFYLTFVKARIVLLDKVTGAQP